MSRKVGPLLVTLALVSSTGGAALADDGGAAGVTLAATDFTLTLSRVDGAGAATVLGADELMTYFSVARCACPTGVLAGLTLSSDAAAQLGTHAVDAQLVVGNDCDVAAAPACTSVGAGLTLSASKQSSTQTLMTSTIFTAAGAAGCAGASATSTRLWAIVRLDGARLATQPSLGLTLGGAGPQPPKDVKLATADQGLLVSWTATGDATTLQGHQVLCSPGPATASAARYDTCPASAPDGGAGPFATLDPKLICSDLIAAGTNAVRVHGLDNGRTYDVAVVAVGIDGTPSAPSVAVQGAPGPTFGFEDLYQQHGGTAQAGCAVGGAGSGGEAGTGAGWGALGGGVGMAVALLVGGRRNRRRRRGGFGGAVAPLVMIAGLACLGASQAQAQSDDDPASSLLGPRDESRLLPSPRWWNLELRFGPYRPNVDSEFADRGSTARPFEEIFGSSRRLMMQLELDRQLVHRAGTWSLGLGVGYYRASAAALAADLKTPSGDETALRLIPLSAALVYRADTLRARYGSPVVPYAKLGLDCTLWQASDTSQASTDGKTLGWHAAAGLTFDLSSLDPEAAQTMDRETGVNQTALFVEIARFSLDGFGSSSVLRVGDTTWFAGLMLEL